MRKILYIIMFLHTLSSFGQLEMRGNTIFTPAQEKAFKERYANPEQSFPLTQKGFSNEVGNIKLGASEFFHDFSTGGVGHDRGGWYPTSDMVIDGSSTNPFQPYGDNYSVFPRQLYNIHFAALDAYATGDVPKAMAVFRELAHLANRSHLDFSNQTVFDRTKMSFENPVFYAAAKMQQYRVSYALIFDLVKNTKYYQDNKITVNSWFKDAADYFKAVIDNNLDYWVMSGDWHSDSGITPRTGNLNDFYTYYDATGNTGYNEVGDFQFNTVNNRAWRLISFVGGYGYSFGENNYIDWAFDLFKFTLKIGQFPDNTFMEHVRSDSYNGGAVPDKELGIDYTWETYMGLTKMALENEVAVERGLLPSDHRGRYFDYSTSIGTDEMFTSYTYTSTSGGPKSLKGGLINLSKYYTQEFQRYNTNGELISPTEQTFSLITAMANTYYEDKELENFYLFNRQANYPPANSRNRAFGVRPSNFGIGIGVGAASGGIVGYGKVYGSYSNMVGIPDAEAVNVGTADKTLTLSDFGKWHYTTGSPTLVVPNVAGNGNVATFQPISENGTITIVPDAGVTFHGNGITSGFQVREKNIGSIKKLFDNNYSVVGNVVPYTAPYQSNNIFPNGNAASQNDANSTNGWSVDGCSVSSVAVANKGNVIEATDTDASSGYDYISYAVPIDNGDTYTVSFDYRVITSGNGTIGLQYWTGVTTSPTVDFNLDGNWHVETFSVTTNDTSMGMRFYTSKYSTVSSGNSIQIDNIVIEKQ